MKKIITALFLSLLLPLVFVSAQVSPSVTIQSLSPGMTVSPGTAVYFIAAVSGFSSGVNYSIGDSIASSIGTATINNNGNFLWIPNSSDAGTHTITITATDQSGHVASASQQITVNGVPSVIIQSLSPGTSVTAGSAVFFTAGALNFNNPVFSISDSFFGSSLQSSNINPSGGFSWITKSYDIGTHTITVAANDSSGNSASASQSITVSAPATSTIQSISPGTTLSLGQTLTFTVVATGFSSPVFTVSDSVYGSTISNSNINSSGAFSWNPLNQDAGTHNLSIGVSDYSGQSSNLNLTIHVQNATVVIQSVSPTGGTIKVGTLFSFTAQSSGLTNPTYIISDSLTGGTIPTSGVASSSGYFLWTPTGSDIGNHNITVRAIDSYGHSANASLSLYVTSNITAPPGIILQNLNYPVPTTPASHVFTANLSLGSTGDDVTALQNVLISGGFYSGSVTGYFGALTEAAVKKYQTAHGISSLGVIGALTRAVLNQSQTTAPLPSTTSTTNTTSSSYKFYSPLSLGSSGNDVTELQKRLTSEGVYSGPITGYFGAMTMVSVKKYQSQHGIQQLGNVGPSTRKALNGN